MKVDEQKRGRASQGEGAKSQTSRCPGKHDAMALLPQTLGFSSWGDGPVLLALGFMCPCGHSGYGFLPPRSRSRLTFNREEGVWGMEDAE